MTRVAVALLGATIAAAVIALPSYGAGTHADATPRGQIDPVLETTVDLETGGRLTTIDFYSRALHKEADYLIYTPAGYSPGQRLPVSTSCTGCRASRWRSPSTPTSRSASSS